MNDYAFTYQGLSFGNGTQMQLEKAVGLEDLPPVKVGDVQRSQKPGSFAGVDYPDPRVIGIDLLIFDGATPIRTLLESLKAVTITVEGQTLLPLVFQVPGNTSRRVYVRPRRRLIPIDLDYSFRKAHAALEFLAVDPRIYDDTLTALSTTLPSGSAGLTFNATADFSFGGAVTGGFVTAINLGNYRAPWTATIPGPVTNPSIQHVGLGVALNFTGTVNTGESLVIDSDAQTVLLNGTASRYSWLNPGSQWFEVLPGTNTINFRAGSGAGGTNQFNFRSAWL